MSKSEFEKSVDDYVQRELRKYANAAAEIIDQGTEVAARRAA